MKRFVIVVDTQADFMRADGALYVSEANTLIGPMQARLCSLLERDTAGVLFTFDTHSTETYGGSAEAEQFPVHCLRGTEGWENVLHPEAVDHTIPIYRLEKHVFDMWAEPDAAIELSATGEQIARDHFFAELKAQGVTDVSVFGVAADYCLRWAIEGLLTRGFAVEVPAHLTRGIARSIEQVIAEQFGDAQVQLEAAA
jgi:nicotinamidase/pyrazinamidase